MQKNLHRALRRNSLQKGVGQGRAPSTNQRKFCYPMWFLVHLKSAVNNKYLLREVILSQLSLSPLFSKGWNFGTAADRDIKQKWQPTLSLPRETAASPTTKAGLLLLSTATQSSNFINKCQDGFTQTSMLFGNGDVRLGFKIQGSPWIPWWEPIKHRFWSCPVYGPWGFSHCFRSGTRHHS